MGRCSLSNEVKKYPELACQLGITLIWKYGLKKKVRLCGQCPNYQIGGLRSEWLGRHYACGRNFRGKHFLSIEGD